ncbi:Major Facilitator Superfamily [Aspergillus sclerotialis]|uniref:Major Facilitator Superfamily n=1 Tax=Aspergillus sclerotialis TaxID=2070753 RepID=A0A3A3A0X6_9EURO|nr:Major Facilitator Superfamily [Aspergillus sclerotialis]
MRETNATILLERKIKRLQKETGNPNLTSKMDLKRSPREMLVRAIIRPAKMLIFSPVVLLLSLYAALVYGLMYLLFATIPSVFGEQYGFNPGTAGLAYLGLGLGMMFALGIFAVLSDKLLGQKKGGTVARPELRLILMKWFGPIIPIGCFIYGWTAYYHVHWIVPILGTLIIGFGNFLIVMPVQIYLVDAFGPQAAASAIAANLVVRNLFGTFLALAAPPLYGRLGLGWGNSLLGFICLAFTPVPWLFYRYGEFLRTRFVVKL